MTYLERLAVELVLGLAAVPEEIRTRHAQYLTRSQERDGGWTGREGPSDLYYTGFALRSLAVLDALTPSVRERAAEFLRSNLQQRASVVDFFSFLYAAGLLQASGGPDVLADTPAGWQDRIATELSSFRTSDGGYAKTPGNSAGSTYHTFLVALCQELIERALPEPGRLCAFLQTRRREDGGYVEIAPMKRSGTNPTAAAVATLRILGAEPGPGVAEFLLSMASPEGGLRANGRIPAADLLSTFTGLWTLRELGQAGQLDRAAIGRFVEQLESPTGGFRAGLWDEQVDVEYTFYGLGTLALLQL
jgi:geranylgeranyl transferase type-2 subunit beta